MSAGYNKNSWLSVKLVEVICFRFKIYNLWVKYLMVIMMNTLQWRYNERDGVSNHQHHHCLLNRFFSGADQRKHQSSTSLAFVWGIHKNSWLSVKLVEVICFRFRIYNLWVKYLMVIMMNTLQWRCNERDGVSNHQHHHCLLNRFFRSRSKKTSKLHVTGLCVGNSPVTGEFPSQMVSNAEKVSIWWRYHDTIVEPVLTRIELH